MRASSQRKRSDQSRPALNLTPSSPTDEDVKPFLARVKAKLDAQQYPNSRLTLTLYTLSLDQKWMKL